MLDEILSSARAGRANRSLPIPLAAEVRLERRDLTAVTFGYDGTHVYSIAVDRVNLLTGGGIYLIGSASGNDNPNTNYSSVDSRGGVMTNGGPAFSLTFWQKSANVLGFRAEIRPVAGAINTLSMPFDFDKAQFITFSFGGSRYFVNNATTPTSYRSGTYVPFASILTPYPIYSNGQKLGYAGAISTKEPTTWGQVQSAHAAVRVNVLSASHYLSMGFTNHFGTNNMGLNFGAFRPGDSARVEGEIVVIRR